MARQAHRGRVKAPHDEGAAGGRPQSSSNSSDIAKYASQTALPVPWQVVPRVFAVIAGSGRERFVMVYRCRECGARHVAHARALKPAMRRKTACGLGVVVLHAEPLQAVA